MTMPHIECPAEDCSFEVSSKLGGWRGWMVVGPKMKDHIIAKHRMRLTTKEILQGSGDKRRERHIDTVKEQVRLNKEYGLPTKPMLKMLDELKSQYKAIKEKRMAPLPKPHAWHCEPVGPNKCDCRRPR